MQCLMSVPCRVVLCADPACSVLPPQYVSCRDWIVDTSGSGATTPCPDLPCCTSSDTNAQTAAQVLSARKSYTQAHTQTHPHRYAPEACFLHRQCEGRVCMCVIGCVWHVHCAAAAMHGPGSSLHRRGARLDHTWVAMAVSVSGKLPTTLATHIVW